MVTQRHVNTYRSGLEEKNSKFLKGNCVPFSYEKVKLRYIKPESKHTYTPDFLLLNTGVFIETKGIFDSADRKKHLLVRDLHPALDIRFVFSNSKAKLYKGSKTTYAMWCTKNGFMYADKLIPKEWLT